MICAHLPFFICRKNQHESTLDPEGSNSWQRLFLKFQPIFKPTPSLIDLDAHLEYQWEPKRERKAREMFLGLSKALRCSLDSTSYLMGSSVLQDTLQYIKVIFKERIKIWQICNFPCTGKHEPTRAKWNQYYGFYIFTLEWSKITSSNSQVGRMASVAVRQNKP